ncbi:hypothetical protein DAPPUDRAFT_97448 [Daphnia pulex]|uniref:Uncharacterized protein n=1 Tax=Daphnia pulex TaxID=6669 RepID=E9G025_DAPPU|nr:hypothetical protein DAPPUDRAFT_97448 [Daphnia pulex]|eukprot:EFX87161.1 hypothetical protein DAPPUDRAFT_97448 [Daphnia pulex]
MDKALSLTSGRNAKGSISLQVAYDQPFHNRRFAECIIQLIQRKLKAMLGNLQSKLVRTLTQTQKTAAAALQQKINYSPSSDNWKTVGVILSSSLDSLHLLDSLEKPDWCYQGCEHQTGSDFRISTTETCNDILHVLRGSSIVIVAAPAPDLPKGPVRQCTIGTSPLTMR